MGIISRIVAFIAIVGMYFEKVSKAVEPATEVKNELVNLVRVYKWVEEVEYYVIEKCKGSSYQSEPQDSLDTTKDSLQYKDIVF